jgi:5-oxoprolinase (ATP-hydrolysing)
MCFGIRASFLCLNRNPGYNDPMKKQCWIDVGGTFTDCVAVLEDGSLQIQKVLSNEQGFPFAGEVVLLGTTRGTNAFLERKGAKTAFVTTKGFADLLEIGTQQREKLFSLKIEKPSQLYQRVIELDERIDAKGNVLLPLNLNEVREKLELLKKEGIESLAVCLLFSYKNPQHEKLILEMAKELKFSHVSLSSQLVPLQKVVPRADTTVIDAYLTPVIMRYVENLQKEHEELKLMTSAGGLVAPGQFIGKDSLFSGPAGGVVGAAETAKSAGFTKVIGFDMGGTSTDVSRYDGSFEYLFEERFQGKFLLSPMLHIETVASGGGSICWFDGEFPRVGPESAGADPGPACYGRGGPLTLSDCNLFLGRILADTFPFPLDVEAVSKKMEPLLKAMPGYTKEELALGFLEIANEKMGLAIKKISLQRGYDPREYVLNCFGGAAAQHGLAIAAHLGIQKVLVSPFASVLSAYGMGCADTVTFTEVMANCPLEELPALEERLKKEECATRLYEMRYLGQEWTLTLTEPTREAFEALHQTRYGFIYPGHPLEVVTVRLKKVELRKKPSLNSFPLEEKEGRAAKSARCFFGNQWCDVPTYENLKPGHWVRGPALIAWPFSVIVVEPGWRAAIDPYRNCLLSQEAPPFQKVNEVCDPITLELFFHKFTSIAEQMGVVLKKTALSVNVKERLDFSCALFTAKGDLVVNAPHIPVHLGGMSECIKCLMEDVFDMKPGDVFITNDPFRGGSHLPDVTVITPIFYQGQRLFFTASRAHHAEIGGIAPGSMPPFAKSLAEEGVLLRALRYDREQLKKTLTEAPYPTRALEDNLADIHAAISANRLGEEKLLELVESYSLPVVEAYMGHIQQAARRKMEAALQKMKPGRYTFTDQMDNGAKIAVAITIEGKKAILDFTGTDPVDPGNFNAPPSIVTSCVLYAFRSLIDEDIPLNAGILEPLTVVLPQNCLLNPLGTPAVGAGNVETSQRIVDVIFGALKTCAASQGTMNNLLFGNTRFAYYETIGGGAGAGPFYDGASGVHTHMTNTRLTDPEIIESRYPVRLWQFSLRRGSGGKGKRSGGDGLIRKLEFLEELEVSLVTSRRLTSPYGQEGGEPGKAGRNALNGEELGFAASFQAKPGDVLIIETPGGGGWSNKS